MPRRTGLDFTSSLFLGLHHGSASLPPWASLTTGVPAALHERPPRHGGSRGRGRSRTGAGRASSAAPTLHALMDVMGDAPAPRRHRRDRRGRLPARRLGGLRAARRRRSRAAVPAPPAASRSCRSRSAAVRAHRRLVPRLQPAGAAAELRRARREAGGAADRRRLAGLRCARQPDGRGRVRRRQRARRAGAGWITTHRAGRRLAGQGLRGAAGRDHRRPRDDRGDSPAEGGNRVHSSPPSAADLAAAEPGAARRGRQRALAGTGCSAMCCACATGCATAACRQRPAVPGREHPVAGVRTRPGCVARSFASAGIRACCSSHGCRRRRRADLSAARRSHAADSTGSTLACGRSPSTGCGMSRPPVIDAHCHAGDSATGSPDRGTPTHRSTATVAAPRAAGIDRDGAAGSAHVGLPLRQPGGRARW